MLPLFKSHYSIGKSILTLNPPSEDDGGSVSVFDIAKRNKLNKLILVEDSLIGFLEAKKNAEALDIQLIFGLRIDVCDDMSIIPDKKNPVCIHKMIVFANNTNGCILLNKIYSLAFTKGGGKIDFNSFKTLVLTLSLYLY